MNQEQLAMRIGVQQSTVSDWLAAKKTPGPRNMARLLDALKLSWDDVAAPAPPAMQQQLDRLAGRVAALESLLAERDGHAEERDLQARVDALLAENRSLEAEITRLRGEIGALERVLSAAPRLAAKSRQA